MELERRKIASKRNLTLVIQTNAIDSRMIDIFITREIDRTNSMPFTRLAITAPARDRERVVKSATAMVMSDQYGRGLDAQRIHFHVNSS